MAVSKDEVMNALATFKDLLDSAYEEKFALKDDLLNLSGGSDEALKNTVDELKSDLEGLQDSVSEHGSSIDDLKNQSNDLADEKITYADVANLFNND